MQLTNEQAERLVEQYGDLLLRVAWSWTGSAADAQDVCQTVLLRLLTAGKTFGSPEAERAWLIRVAVNQSRKLLRSAWFRRSRPLEDCAALLEEAAPEESGVFQAVMNLPQKYRTPLYLYYYEGYAVREVASLCGLKESTVSTRLQRARQKLKQMLEEGS